MPKTFIIAEAGVNHNGSLKLALDLVDAAKDTGADAVKFQTFDPKKLVSSKAEKAEYQKETTGEGSQQEMLEKLRLSAHEFSTIADHAKKKGIEFMSSAFDEGSLDIVVSLSVPRLKLGSGELTSGPMLYACAQTGLPLILSTGMGTIEQIREALCLLAQSYLNPKMLPDAKTWKGVYESAAGQKILKERVTLLHCTTAYPCPEDQVDLQAMAHLRSEFGLPVGYSDHTEGIAVSIAAAALGARVIEKHFTIDRNLPGPDHKASLDVTSFTEMVKGIRQVESALGSAEKFIRPIEAEISKVARRSVVAARPIKKGEKLTLENLTSKRPGTGISPMRLWELLGKEAGRDYGEDDLIEGM